MRIGSGYDSHRFAGAADGAGEKVQRLGGVPVPECPPLLGHSDADVLVHAIIDALLGAAALGDIGSHFPDSDPRWRNADSAEMLRMAVDRLAAAGYRVANVDATVICERPKIAPYVPAIRKSLAGCMAIPENAVSVKGKTNEGMDATGRGEGIAVHAVALIESAAG